MRRMYDSVTIADIPSDGQLIGAYANGRYANYDHARIRFPHLPVVAISVTGTLPAQMAHVLDVEGGDARPEEFHEWARQVANRGVLRPTCYCSLSTASAVVQLAPKGVITDFWIAHWTGQSHRPSVPGGQVVACQWAAPGHGSPGHYDISTVFDDSWHTG